MGFEDCFPGILVFTSIQILVYRIAGGDMSRLGSGLGTVDGVCSWFFRNLRCILSLSLLPRAYISSGLLRLGLGSATRFRFRTSLHMFSDTPEFLLCHVSSLSSHLSLAWESSAVPPTLKIRVRVGQGL